MEFKVGDKVQHVNSPMWRGVVVASDWSTRPFHVRVKLDHNNQYVNVYSKVLKLKDW